MGVRGCGLGYDHRVPEVLQNKLAPMLTLGLVGLNSDLIPRHSVHYALIPRYSVDEAWLCLLHWVGSA